MVANQAKKHGALFQRALYVAATVCFLYSRLVSANKQEILPDQLFNLPMAKNHSPEKEHRVKLETHSLLQPVGESKVGRQSVEKTCEGACISPRACDYHGGATKGHCATGSVCCKFERSCRGVSKEKISFFKSPTYPSYLNESLECSYNIYPTEDVCAIRVDFLDMELHKAIKYPRTEKCILDSMYILNTLNGANEALCEMGQYSSIFYVNSKSPKPVNILFVMQSKKYRWNLKLTQINCKSLQPWKNDMDCGRQLMYEPSETNDHESGPDLNVDDLPSPIHPNTPLIVNGDNVEGREFPWQISLQITPTHRCGGTIINQRFILTAAHCVMGRSYESLKKMRVVVGDLVLNTTEDGQHEDLEVESIVVNLHYKTFQSYINDIAIIKVAKDIKYTESIQPICLPPSKGFTTDNRDAVISGWGRRNGTSPNSPKSIAYRLQKLTVRVLPDDECREYVRKEISILVKKNITANDTHKYAELGYHKSQLCAIAKKNATVCFGDSGGGLVMQNEEDGRYFQVGVVSYGLGQCVVTRITPVAYTKVSEYLQFIAMATSE